MNARLWSTLAFAIVVAILVACSGERSRTDRVSLASPAPTARAPDQPTQASALFLTIPTDSPLLITFLDSERTITLHLGSSFALELGCSPGSPWIVHVADPELLEPAIDQLGPDGRRVVFETVRPGQTRIEAGSHGICVHPGPCPEDFRNFALNVQVLAD